MLIFVFGWNFHWLLWGLFIQLNISVIIYIFVIIKRKIGTDFSEKTKSIILALLVCINCAMFGGNMYSNYEYFDQKKQERVQILYMNDKYILHPEGVAKNDSGLVLKRIEMAEE